MTCPKCGTASEEGRVECSACGIIFARWRVAKPKHLPAEPRGSSTAHAWRSPLVISIAAVVVLYGLMWAAKPSDDPGVRAPAPPEVSTASPATQSIAHTSEQQGRSGSMTAQNPAEVEIRQAIERCSFFQESLTLTFPKSISPGIMRLLAETYPGLVLAANMGLLEFDPPFDASNASRHLSDPTRPEQTSVVKLGAAAAGKPIHDSGATFRMDLGRRRIETITNVYRSTGKVTAVYRWTVEATDLVEFAPESRFRIGGAELAPEGGGWKSTRVWINTDSAARILCSN